MAMLPPVDPSVLKSNPNFEVLYRDLCTRKLNPDGSTRDTKKQRMHDEIRRNLTTTRTALLESQILIQTLSTLPSKSASLPSDLHPVIELVTAQLNNQVPLSDRAVLSGDIDLFTSNIDIIASALSTQLTTTTTLLRTIANPANPPEISTLPAHAENLLKEATILLPRALAEEKIHLANTSHTLLALHRTLLETSIRILEQTQHGALARATKTKAELLHARAVALGLQARIHTLTHPPPAAFVAALKNFKAEQGAGEAKLRDREALARRTLELYERAGEKGMRDLAKRKEYLVDEIRRVEGEIEGLEKGK